MILRSRAVLPKSPRDSWRPAGKVVVPALSPVGVVDRHLPSFSSLVSSLLAPCLLAETRVSSGALPNAGKVTARPRNLTARGGKNAV